MTSSYNTFQLHLRFEECKASFSKIFNTSKKHAKPTLRINVINKSSFLYEIYSNLTAVGIENDLKYESIFHFVFQFTSL